MSRFWSPIVSQLTPYIPGEQPKIDKLVKLNTNENPYGPSPRVLAAIHDQTSEALRLYPDPGAEALRATIANHHKLSPDQIFVGNGSDEVLALVFLSLLNHTEPLLFPDISYSFYPVYCRLFGLSYATVPLNDAMEIDISGYRHANGGVIFPNPNAPTGRLLALSEIEEMVAANVDSVVVVDEAYIDFGGGLDISSIPTAIPLLAKYPNLLVVQTLSKSRSLAGLRVGFAAGHSDLIEALNRVKNSFNSYPLDRLAQAGAIAAFQDEEYFAKTRQAVIASRTSLTKGLEQIGFEVIPSAANFVFARHPMHDAAKIAAALRQEGVIVRHFSAPRIHQFLRITIGTDAQCQALLAALLVLVA
jgi:histidinol-phosphate aminotransferase